MNPCRTARRSALKRRHAVLLAAQTAAALVLLGFAGCSTAPIADLLDFFSPGRIPAAAKDVSGGVCVPQGGPAGGVLVGPPVAPTVPFKGVPPGGFEPPPPAPISQTPLPGSGK